MGFPKRNVLHLYGITEILNLLEKKGRMRFGKIMNQLKEAMDPPLKNAAALSYRLRALENAGLILNNTEKKTGKQVKIFYEITKKGRSALVHMRELEKIMY